ncbi:MAG TPA: alkaline phosphatase PhoX [Thermoleophilaceae bacterium]|nr:alkaline phosphatase PhoX [Thermoleophilaceae bacterium]
MSTPDLHADPSEAAALPLRGKLTTPTRRDFIRGNAAAGASTVGAAAMQASGADLFSEEALAQGRRNSFSRFTAIAPSSADAFEVAPEFRADVLIAWGDVFRDGRRRALRYGFNNDFLAYFPLRGSREGLLFVNHEYPDPFFLHGYKPNGSPKNAAQVQEEQDSVGNSIVHVKRRRNGGWNVVSPSDYNRRIYGDRPTLEFTGPLAGAERVGDSANGSVANCSGGVTPWGTALSCEENYDDYGLDLEADGSDAYGWHQGGGEPEDAEYHPKNFAKYGWVCEHNPYDPDDVGRKHTALGRFRHENTAFRHEPGSRFVLYMGDDKTNEGVYKFVSKRKFRPRQWWSNRRILEEGELYIARWEPEGRRRFAKAGDRDPISPTRGTGRWVPVPEEALEDTAAKLRAAYGDEEYDTHFATNRPEDIEVAADGSVFIALTNNSTVKDSHGSVRRLRERRNDPEALEFRWRDYAAGGPTGSADPGEQGFSSPDNLVFDKARNLWVVTDISSSRLNEDNEYAFHKNNAMFMVPTSGPNKGVAFRFANGPVECEITGPYFTPDEQTLFVNVQHPGEMTGSASDAPGVFGQETTYTSWWPEGNRTANENPATPKPATVVITRAREDGEDEE